MAGLALILREGSWNRKTDEKMRLAIPVKIRKQAGTEWILGYDKFRHEIVLMPLGVWREKLESARDTDRLRNYWIAFSESTDAQGRVTIPRELRDLGQLGRDLTVTVRGDRLIVKNTPLRLPKSG